MPDYYSMISLDSETTGIDHFHGARPFYVSSCDEAGVVTYFEWEVDPLTRRPIVPVADLLAIRRLIDAVGAVAMQNGKFDVHALTSLFADHKMELSWPWHKTRDTIVAGHLLASNRPHNLTDMTLEYLGVDIQRFEDATEAAVQECRRWCRSNLPEWVIASEGRPDMPSAREKTWKYDLWLPRALAKHRKMPANHAWWTVTRDYANADAEVTLALWRAMEAEIEQNGLRRLFDEMMRLVPALWRMEQRGVTVSRKRLDEKLADLSRDIEQCDRVCVSLSSGMLESVPRGVSHALRRLLFDHFKLPPVNRGEKSGEPSVDKITIDRWLEELPEGDARAFVSNMREFKVKTTEQNYLQSYRRYGVPKAPGWYVLHPSVKQSSTDTTRLSSENPNEQNVKKGVGGLRSVFGPMPGREWWPIDGENLELRLAAFAAKEEELIEVFMHPERPPFYGSYHLIIFALLHPHEFNEHGAAAKDLCQDKYKKTKNGNFAVLYGAQEATADRAYGVRGAYQKIRNRFPRAARLADEMVRMAERRGFIETMRDREVGGERGYPLITARGEWGRVSPTVPFNYFIQGSASFWMRRAIIKVDGFFKRLNAGERFDGRTWPGDYYLPLTVHDELVPDCPRFDDPMHNLPVIREVARLMESCGAAIGVPTPVAVSRTTRGWDKAENISIA